MVTDILNRLRFYLTVLSQAALLLYAGAAQATTVHLAQGLEIILPSSLALEVIAPQDQINSPIIAGEVSGEPGYFIAATKVKNREKNSVLWNRLESEIRKRSNTGEFTVSQRGNFSTSINNMVWFRVYHYETINQAHRQVYFLLKDQRTTYWITLTMVEGVNINLTIPIAQALIRRARVEQTIIYP
jgi:hypothetical protein